MKKALVSGYIGFDNFGDEAIFLALSNHLKENNIEVSALCCDKEKVEKKYNVKTYYFKSITEIIKAISKTDILISGGGSLLQNKTSSASLFYYLFIILLAKLFSKKVMIFSQGIEKIKGEFETFLTKNVLKLADFISVRDENSKKLLSSWNIDAILTSDPVYSLIQNINASNNKQDLIIQLREFDNLNDEFLSSLAEIIAKNSNCAVNVFSFQDKYDEKICKKFISKLKTFGTCANFISQKSISDTINIINNSKYVISTRFHGALISHALNCKTFALSYDDKIKNLANELSIEQIDLNNYTKEELTKKLKTFLNEEKENKIPYRKYSWEEFDKFIKN